MILLIDNYDSFTWNLYQYFCELGADVLVKRNDELTLPQIDALGPQKIVISPALVRLMTLAFRWRRFAITPGDCQCLASVLGIRRWRRPSAQRLSARRR